MSGKRLQHRVLVGSRSGTTARCSSLLRSDADLSRAGQYLAGGLSQKFACIIFRQGLVEKALGRFEFNRDPVAVKSDIRSLLEVRGHDSSLRSYLLDQSCTGIPR